MSERFVRLCRLEDAVALSHRLSRGPEEEWIWRGGEIGMLCAVHLPPLVQITIDPQLKTRGLESKGAQATSLAESAAA